MSVYINATPILARLQNSLIPVAIKSPGHPHLILMDIVRITRDGPVERNEAKKWHALGLTTRGVTREQRVGTKPIAGTVRYTVLYAAV